MKLYHYFSPNSLTNIYVLAEDSSRSAMIVDPAVFDVPLLELIEGRGLHLDSVLVTHETESHLRGLRTLLKVYDATIYAANAQVLEFESHPVGNMGRFTASGLAVEPISLPGYWSDALIYRVGGVLLTGEVLGAGRIGESINPYARELLRADLRERVLTLPPDTIVLPSSGPPSTLAVELATNREITETV